MAAVLAALQLAFAPASYAAGKPAHMGFRTAVREYDLPGHGALTMNVPNTWDDEVEQPGGEFPPAITLSANPDDHTRMVLTPLWSRSMRADFNSPAKVRKLLERDGREMLPKAEETELDVKEVPRGEGSLYYFTLTGKAPKQGDYKYVTRAGLGTGGILVMVTILSDSKDSAGLQEALDMLKGARNTGGGK